MGMFDSVFVECPHCGQMNELQTKNGECILGKYDLVNAPPEVLLGVEGIHKCSVPELDVRNLKRVDMGCESNFVVHVQCITKAWIENE